MAIRLPNGEIHYIAERFKHPKGILCFWPFWHLQRPEEGIELIKGWIHGEGPWKIGDHVISILVHRLAQNIGLSCSVCIQG